MGNYRHGFSHTRIDNIYKSMVSRCNKPKDSSYKRYGARGITVCEEWTKDKTKFFEWAFENGYTDELTIDRIDNSKGYSPANCRWATYKEQANNTRNNHVIDAFGQRHTMTEWSDITGIKVGTIWMRLKKGWDVEMALTAEVSPYRKRAIV